MSQYKGINELGFQFFHAVNKNFNMQSTLEKFEHWYHLQCDGVWEHNNSVKIYGIDNPGWAVVITLEDTKWENLQLDTGLVEVSEDDWYNIKMSNFIFKGIGDAKKLNFILSFFLSIVLE